MQISIHPSESKFPPLSSEPGIVWEALSSLDWHTDLNISEINPRDPVTARYHINENDNLQLRILRWKYEHFTFPCNPLRFNMYDFAPKYNWAHEVESHPLYLTFMATKIWNKKIK